MNHEDEPDPPAPPAPLARTLSLGRAPMGLRRQQSFERTIPHDRMPLPLSARFSSVVLFEVSGVEPDYIRPWQKAGQKSWTGSGFAIDGRRILTNWHVVEHATDIRLRKHGHSKRFAGRVICQGADVDLAVVEVTEDAGAFWEGVPAVAWAADLPPLQSSVNVVGFPTGGRTICVTEGVVSRVDAKNYRLGASSVANPGKILVVQIDAAINGGNSGGPVFNDNGDVAGVAFQGLGGDAQNVGYVIPSLVALNFLHRVAQSEAAASAAAGTEGAASPAKKRAKHEGGGGGGASSAAAAAAAEVTEVAEAGGAGAAAAPGRSKPRVSYMGVPEIPFKWQSLQNKSLRKLLRVGPEVSGVVVTSVSPLARQAAIVAAAAAANAEGAAGSSARAVAGTAKETGEKEEGGEEEGEEGAGEDGQHACFLMVDDVITAIDSKPVGDDFTVPLRGEELVAGDFLVTGKRCDEPTTFDVMRGGAPLRLCATLGSLHPRLPRQHGADTEPNWQCIGGLLFVPLTCPLVDMDIRRLYDAGFHSVSVESERLMSAFCQDMSEEVILLVDIMACDTNFGYSLRRSWRVLVSVNGVVVSNMAHLHTLYADACEGAEGKKAGGEWEFLKFVFSDQSRIVLETESCIECEADVLAANGLPAPASAAVMAAAAKEEA